MKDFVHTILTDREPRITGEDGLKALAIAVAAEESHKRSLPIAVEHEQAYSTS
jgi:predicted dehydrogenase